MKKISKWIKRNKGLFVVLLLTLVLLIFLAVIFVRLLIGGSSNPYGNRLDGIESVKIDKDTYDGVKAELEGSDSVASAEVRLQGKIVYTTIVLNSTTSESKAKELATATLYNYKDEELKFYDFSYFLKWESEEGDKVITGNKHHANDKISWVNS